MPYWAWLVLGIFLLGAELTAIDAAFYLIFIGAAAIVVGLIELVVPGLPVWVQWVSFGVIAAVSMVLFRERLYNKLRGGVVGFEDSASSNVVRITEDLAPGDSIRVEHRGSTWTAKNVGTEAIDSGSDALIVSVEGLTLRVTRQS